MKAATTRSVDDPRVRRVLRAIDRAIASPHDRESGLAQSVTEAILTEGTTVSDRYSAWSRDGLRALVLAYARHAPSAELTALAREADRQFDRMEHWDRRGWIEFELVEGPECDALVDLYGAALESGVDTDKAIAMVRRAIKRSERAARKAAKTTETLTPAVH